MDFSEAIRERRPLFIYTFALVRHPHLKSPLGKSKPRPLRAHPKRLDS
jgi:hypothetical protein